MKGLKQVAAFDDEGRTAHRDALRGQLAGAAAVRVARSQYFAARRTAHDAAPRVLLTVLNVPLMLPARFLTTVMSATTIKPINTAYSTAVGPSSLAKNRRISEDICRHRFHLVEVGRKTGSRVTLATFSLATTDLLQT